MLAVVVVILDVDDEEGEGGGEDAQRRKSVMHESLPYAYCTHAMLCTMHVFSAVILPFKSFVGFCPHLMLRVDDLCRFYA